MKMIPISSMKTTGSKIHPSEVEVVHQIECFFGWHHCPRRTKSCLSAKRNHPELECLLQELVLLCLKRVGKRVGESMGSIHNPI